LTVTHEWITHRVGVSETGGHEIRVEKVDIVVRQCGAQQTVLGANAVINDKYIVWQPTDDEHYCNW
jgi:hypothetical protein